MDAKLGLPAVNFLLADVGGGLGPFLSTWLAQTRHWNPEQIGLVLAIGMGAGAILSPFAGSVVDRLRTPRLLLLVSCGMILGGTLLLLPFQAFLLVAAAQVVVSAGGALGGPSMTGLSLAIVGKEKFPRQQGTNDAANHAGNVFAASAIAGIAWFIGPVAAIVVLGVMATATIVTLCLFRSEDIDGDRMLGRKKRERGAKRGDTRKLLRSRNLWTLYGVLAAFQFGNATMLPLLGQRVAAAGGNATSWMSACIIVAEVTMVPVALVVGRVADRVGRKPLLGFALVVCLARCTLAVFAGSNAWLLPIEVLDGLAAGVFSVAVPVSVADLTYGTGRTQTAMGGVGAVMSGSSAAASAGFGFIAHHLGYPATFGTMAVFPLIGLALLWTMTFKNVAEQHAEREKAGSAGQAEPALAG